VTFLWHQVIHDGENSLLHFSSVLTAQNDHFSLLEVESDASVTVNVRNVFIGMELSLKSQKTYLH
jgi:hypothetical protein